MGKDAPQWYTLAARQHFETLYAGGEFLPSRQAAALLSKSKGTGHTFMLWFQGNWQDFAPDRGEAEPVEALNEADDTKTWVDERSGTVFTELGSDYGRVVMTQGEFRSFRRDYSRYWGSRAMSQIDLAYKYRLPSAHAVAIFTRIHGIRQSSIPVTDAELSEEGVDAMVDKTLESNRQSYLMKLQLKEREAEKKDAERWRAFEVNAHMIASEVRGMMARPAPVALKIPPVQDDPFALLLNGQDVHVGKLAHDTRGNRTYDRAEAVRRSMAALYDLLAQASQRGTPEEIILVVGGDLLHVDSSDMTTVRGTSQAGQSDGNYREILSDAIGLTISQIRAARALAPVHVLIVHGNHDATGNLYIGILLEQAFQGDPRVRVTTQTDGAVFLNYGENSIFVAHGENLKEKDVYRVVVNAAEDAGLPIKRHKMAFVGHVHHSRSVDLNGVILHTSPSLSDPDDWHRANHYSGATVGADLVVIRKRGGRAAVYYTSEDAVMPARSVVS